MMVDKTSGPLTTLKLLNESESSLKKAVEKIASGKQILTAADDPTGLVVSTALEALSRGLSQQMNSRQGEVSLMQTAEGAMSTIGEASQRIRELSIQASNGTLTDSDRQAIQMEIDQMNQHIDQVAANTEFNTKKLLDGSFNMTLQNGNNFTIPNMDSTALGTKNADVTNQANAETAIRIADQAIQQVSSQRSTIGAVQNGITSEISALQEQFQAAVSANSRIADADIAAQVINLTKAKIQTEAAIQVFRMDNAMRGTVLSLLNGV